MNSEIDQVNFLVLGIGINVNHTEADFSDDLRELATSLRLVAGEVCNDSVTGQAGPGFSRSEIIKRILFEIENIYCKIEDGLTEKIIEEWKKYSVTLGREVVISYKNDRFEGTAKDVTSEGKLVVECSDGALHEISSGEVSVRGLLGYL
jgi:BirA family biotin operon repressor/biotin-[acetyl-CoA-carboxylase] ligase